MEAKQVKDLMEAYASVYNQPEEQEVLSEDLQQTVGKALDAAAQNPVVKAIGELIKPVGAGRKTPTKTSGGYRPVVKSVTAEEVETDLFDMVKGYLVSEGYADTEEAALVIMANMSEEWKQSIVEQYTVNVADVKGNTKAAQNAQAGMINKLTGKPMYTPGVGVGPDFKLLKGV